MKTPIRLFAAVLSFTVIASLSSSAQASFWGPGLTENMHGFSNGITSVSLVTNANEVRVRKFTLQSSVTIGHVTTILENGAYSTTFNFGIYDSSGNLLLDSGSFNGSPLVQGTVQTLSVTSVTLAAGTYFFAQTASYSTIQAVGLSGSGSLIAAEAIANAVTTRFAIAANAASGGALPSTLGTLTAEGSSTVGSATPLFEP
jgi:hypothetical protein